MITQKTTSTRFSATIRYPAGTQRPTVLHQLDTVDSQVYFGIEVSDGQAIISELCCSLSSSRTLLIGVYVQRTWSARSGERGGSSERQIIDLEIYSHG